MNAKNSDALQFLIFLSNEFHFAIDVLDVVEIIPLSKTHSEMPAGGALNKFKYQDRQLSLINANEAFFRTPGERPAKFKVLIIECSKTRIALAVDSAEEILHVSPEFFKQTRQQDALLCSELLRGTVEKDEQVFFVIDTRSLFALSEVKEH